MHRPCHNLTFAHCAFSAMASRSIERLRQIKSVIPTMASEP
jgi:hypothetical protein